MSSPISQRHQLLALFIGSLLLRLLWIGTNELSHDEPFTVVMAHRGIADLFAAMSNENNPPLHFLLMHFWVGIVPLEEAWLRVPSAVFSALTVLPIFLIGRSVGGPRVAWTASLLFLFSNYHQGFAHEVRGYALFTLLSATSMWLLVRGTGDAPSRTYDRKLATLVNILLVYTHFFGWFVLGIQAISVLVLRDLRARRIGYLHVLIATLVGFAPYAGLFLYRLGTSMKEGTWLTSPAPEELYNMVWRWSNAPVVAVFALVLILVGIVRTRGRGLGLFLFWTFVPLFGMFAISYQVPMFLDRYLVYAAPGFALLVSLCSASIGLQGRWSHLPAALIVLAFALSFTPWASNGLKPSAVVEQSMTWRGEGPVLILPAYFEDTYAWHLDRRLVQHPMTMRDSLIARGIHPVHRPEDLPNIASGTSPVVLVHTAATDERSLIAIKDTLSAYLHLEEWVEADKKVKVERYVR